MACQETTGLKKQCGHVACREDGIECQYYLCKPDAEPIEYYCLDHCFEHGFCFMCGLFWSGLEEFDFPQYHNVIQGMCPPCSEQTKYDAGELDGQYEDDYVYDPYDFVMP